ncbi:MAG: hypothetical protein AAFQ43_13650, partial [Bacteroidota bacterium]
PRLREAAQNRIRTYIRDRGMNAFAEAQIVPDFASGAVAVSQAHGIGRMEANTVLMGWSRTTSGRGLLLRVLRDLADLHKSVLFLHVDPARGFGDRKTIHVWWGGRGGNGDLMLLLAHLVNLHRDWGGATIRVLRMVGRPAAVEPVRAETERLLEAVRVDADVRIILREDSSRPFVDVMREHSLEADLTVLGMQRPDVDGAESYGEGLQELIGVAGTVLLVHNGEPDEAALDASV